MRAGSRRRLRRQMDPEALDGLGEQLIRRGQGDPEEAPAARPVHGPRRDHHGGFLDDRLRKRGRGVALWNRGPDVDGPLRRLPFDYDVAERTDDEVAAAL